MEFTRPEHGEHQLMPKFKQYTTHGVKSPKYTAIGFCRIIEAPLIVFAFSSQELVFSYDGYKFLEIESEY